MAKAKATPTKPKGNGDYQADAIQVLKGLEAVRRRPAMYIGSVSARGLHHLVYEVVENSVDEELAWYSSGIHLRNTAPNQLTATEKGLGIPNTNTKKGPKPDVHCD